MTSSKKLLIVSVAGLGWDLVHRDPPPSGTMTFQTLEAVFPALTCTAQASFRTASLPQKHGMISNGVFSREFRKALFWEQSAALVIGERIWKNFRERGKRVGMMFWQQSLGEELDLVLSPAPIHKHGGGMVQDCYCRPYDLYDRLTRLIGSSFNLIHYWGPLASKRSSDWIVLATQAVMQSRDWAPDLLLSYLPHLDYDQQRYGPGSKQASKALQQVYSYLDQLRTHAETHGYDFLFFGDYGIDPISKGAVYPNRCLRERALFSARSVKGRYYADLFASSAFAMVDHEIAHVFVPRHERLSEVKEALQKLPGVGLVLDAALQKQRGLDHVRSGELVLVAQPGHWFAYPWWIHPQEAPDYAGHIDIHNKPGYDPCELFFGWPPLRVSQSAQRIKGSHGRGGFDNKAAWASSCHFENRPGTLVELSQATQNWLDAN